LLIGALSFGAWAFTSRQDYKSNSDAKAAAAVELAKQHEDVLKQKEYDEKEKNPLKTWNGPEAYGSLVLKYPKTWSGYVATASSATANSNNLVDAYFTPDVLPSITDQASTFALRIQVLNQSYADVLERFSQKSQDAPTVAAYSLPQLPKIVGVKVTGAVNDKDNVTMVVLPLRAQTIELWTEGPQYVDDFNNNILKYFSFSP
jgi:hypothetical protein